MEGPSVLAADRRVLTPLQGRVLGLVAEAEHAYGSIDLRLEGGTALSAYYLGHRLSEDLDLFGGLEMDARDFSRIVEDRVLADGLHVVARGPLSQGFAELYVADGPGDRDRMPAGTVKVHFGRTSPFKLAPSVPTRESIRVGSYQDLCAGKLHAVCDRYQPRDFIDLHCILHRPEKGEEVPDEDELRRRFSALVDDLEAMDPGLTEVQVGQALARALGRRVLSEFPLRLLVSLEEEQIQATVGLAVEECARLARERANWDRPPT